MSLSLYDVSIPVFIRAFANLSGILEKGRAFAGEKGMAEQELLEARLFPDMLPLAGQVQRASDATRFMTARVTRLELAPMADDETSFEQLQGRIAATVEVLKGVSADSMDGREDAEIVIKTPNVTMTFTGRDYVLLFALPNFFFHVTTAYDILRHKGVPLGKRDYLGRFDR